MALKETIASGEWLMVVYLSHFTRFIDDPESPPQVTAGGITQITLRKRTEVDGLLKSLVRSGHVRSWSNSIKGELKKKKVYFLTKEGENLSTYISDAVKGAYVTIQDDDVEEAKALYADLSCDEKEGKVVGQRTLVERLDAVKGKKIGLLKVQTLLDFNPTLLEVFMGLESKSSISLMKVREAHSRCESMKLVKQWVDFSTHVHKCRNFYGRKKEIEESEDFIDDLDQRILVIKGIDGIGKTSLASAIASRVRGSRHIFWYDFHDHTSLKHMLTSLGFFLSKLEIPTLRNYLSHEADPEITEVLHILETSLFDTNTLMVFEDIYKISDEGTVSFFRELKDATEGMMGAIVLVTGRTMIPFYDQRDIETRNLVKEIPLLGLDEVATGQLLEGEGITGVDKENYMMITKGHPLYCELVAYLGLPSVPKTINFYIETELDSRLSIKEKKLLTILSVYRHPVPSRALMKRAHNFIDGNDEVPTMDTLELLMDKGLIRVDADGENLTLHDIIKEHYYDQMLPRVRRSAHKLAVNYYMEEKEDLFRVEVIYHLTQSDQHERAAQYLVDKKEMLFRTGYFWELLAILRKIDRGLLPSNLVLDLTLLKGGILKKTGHTVEASDQFRMASKMAGQLGNDLARAHSLFELGHVLMDMDMLAEAEVCFTQGMDIVELEGGSEDLARGYSGLGSIFHKREAFDEACDQYEKALLEARKARNIQLACQIVTNMGDALLKRGDIGGATQFFEENFRMLEANRDRYILAKAHALVGLLHTLKEDWAKAIKSFQQGAISAKLSGNSHLLAMNLMEGAIPLFKNGETERAEESLEDAEDIYQRLKDKLGLAHLELRKAEIQELGGNMDSSESSYRVAIKALETLNDNVELSYAYTGIASLLKKKGDRKEAQAFIKKSMDISTRGYGHN